MLFKCAIGLLEINYTFGFHTHYTEHKQNVHFKYLANSLALVYNFYCPAYNSRELAEGYGWKNVMCFPFRLVCFSVLCSMFA